MLTTAGLTRSAMSANDAGAPAAPCPAASGACAAACRGLSSSLPSAIPGLVRWRPPATAMPKIIEAAAINARVTGCPLIFMDFFSLRKVSIGPRRSSVKDGRAGPRQGAPRQPVSDRRAQVRADQDDFRQQEV